MIGPHTEFNLEKLKLENEKLRLEIDTLKRSKDHVDTLSSYIPLISVLVTIAGFGFGIYQYRAQQIENREAQKRLSLQEIDARKTQTERDKENAQRNFMKPLLEKQLSLYFEAASAASTIATTTDLSEKRKAIDTFWRLYYGPLVVVENTVVSGAMKSFGNCLNGVDECNKYEMNDRSLSLATKLQDSMLNSWNMKPEDFTRDKFKY